MLLLLFFSNARNEWEGGLAEDVVSEITAGYRLAKII
jgi:hypothetical protein